MRGFETTDILEGPDAIERQIVGIFEALLDRCGVRPTDGFFDLGGDSVLAVTLILEIERRLGVVLARSTLLEAQSPRQLISAVLEARDNVEAEVLVPIHREGQGPAIFCVHSMRGEVTFVRKLAYAMGGRRPFYGVRAVGLRSGEIMLSSVEAMAAQYEAEIRALQPSGPYLLIGQCGTSVIALELAQRLVAADEEVLGLVLIDPDVGVPWMVSSGEDLASLLMLANERVQAVRGEMERDPSMVALKRQRLVQMGLRVVVAGYTPRRYAGAALLVHSAVRSDRLLDRTSGYGRFLSKLHDVQLGPNHRRLFIDHVDGLAEAVNSFFDIVAPI